MNNKYAEIIKWQEMKQNGVITEEEFEEEKQKILSSTDTVNKTNKEQRNGARILFILTIIFLVITIIITIVDINREDGDIMAELNYKTAVEMNNMYNSDMAKRELQEAKRELQKEKLINNIYEYGRYVCAGITLVLFSMSVILKIKNKGGIKIVD